MKKKISLLLPLLCAVVYFTALIEVTSDHAAQLHVPAEAVETVEIERKST